jgi:hypothetical protein
MRGLQGSITESLRVALATFCKVDNLLGDRLTGRTDRPVSLLKGDNGHLERDARKTTVSASNLWPCK